MLHINRLMFSPLVFASKILFNNKKHIGVALVKLSVSRHLFYIYEIRHSQRQCFVKVKDKAVLLGFFMWRESSGQRILVSYLCDKLGCFL